MVKSMFAAVAGLRAHQAKMDIIGNNIANVNTYGFKKARASFRDQFYATTKGSSEASNVYGGGNPSQVGYGSQIGSIDVNYGTGGMAATGNGMDVMISGNGFFLVGAYFEGGYATSSNSIGANLTNLNLTRVGIFNIDGQGNLVDSNSNYVYGFLQTDVPVLDSNGDPVTDANGDPVTEEKPDKSTLQMLKVPMIYMKADGSVYTEEVTDPNDPNNTITISYFEEGEATALTGDEYLAPMKLNAISIGTNGTVTGMFGEETIIMGTIAIANVPNPNALEATSNGYYKAKNNTGVVTGEVPGEGSTGLLTPGVLEMANVDLAEEFTDMITTQRGFQANTRIITVTDEMLQELVNLKR